MKICILNIATNKYIRFVEQLLNSVEENFLNGHDISALEIGRASCRERV